MADTASIAERLAKILCDHTGEDPANHPDATTLMMVDTLKLDSLDMVEITMAIEDEFDVRVPDDEAEPFVSDRGGDAGKTFSDWVAWVEGLIAKKSSTTEGSTKA